MSNPLHTGGPLPAEATWSDYVNAHGGSEVPGWWVTLCWYGDSEHPRPEVVGPYTSYARAVSAMEASSLIDGFATDTKREEWLDDVYVATDPASIGRTCTDYGHRVTLIDPGDPDHFGPEEPVPGEVPASRVSVRNPVLQVAALESSSMQRPPQQADTARVDHSPGTPGR